MTKPQKKSKLLFLTQDLFVKIALILNSLIFRHQKPSNPNQQLTKQTNSLSRSFDIGDSDDVAYLNSLKKTYQDGVNRSDSEANSTDRGLSTQLILITTVLITSNIIVFGNKELLTTLTIGQRPLLALGLACLIASLILGISYYQEVKNFHKQWATTRNDIVELISNQQVTTYDGLREKITELTSGLSSHINERLLHWQIGVLIGALGVYLLFAISLLFDFRFITAYFSWYK